MGVCGIFLMISTIGMVYLTSLNYRLYKNKVNTKTNLSYRYQVAENIRSFRMLIPMLMLLLLGCMFTISCYCVTLYVKVSC